MAPKLTPKQLSKQQAYRDARSNQQYDKIWQTVGKCVFCDLRDKYIIYEEAGMVLTIILYAYIDGHCLIVPRRHVASLQQLTDQEWAAVRKLSYIAKKLIKDVHGIKGMQLLQKEGATAQSTVEHIHFHCVPFDAPDLCEWNYRQLQHTPLENAQIYQKANAKIQRYAKRFEQKYAEPNQITNDFQADWSQLAFANKSVLNKLKANFIAAPREISATRFRQLVKQYLPQGPIILGLAKEPFIDGFDGQPQFRSLQARTVQKLIDKVNTSSPHKIYTLSYFQRDLDHILSKLKLRQVILVNGSWRQAFHTRSTYHLLHQLGLPYQLVSPFGNEAEAKDYEQKISSQVATNTVLDTTQAYNDADLMQLVSLVAQRSFDHGFQTGAILAHKTKPGYKILAAAHNLVVPHETYALLHGATREQNFSPTNDLNHYDTVHAEALLASNLPPNLKNGSLFINLLPCPHCARLLSQTPVTEVVYQLDHSDGYAVKLLEEAGKTVRRLVA